MVRSVFYSITQNRHERTPGMVAVMDTGKGRGVPPASSFSLIPGQILGALGTKSPDGFSSLVGIGHNSTELASKGIELCPSSGWLRGECEHGEIRWVKLSCKRRTCPVCGVLRKHRISWRIQLGVESLGGSQGAGWFVGTFDHDIAKPAAVQVVGKMIRWLRKETGVHFEYASTWELTEAGRLHVNVIMAPWSYIPQSKLSAAWHRFGGGYRVSIERVGAGIGNETAKAGRERIGNYVGKWEQLVRSGRGVTYSRGWPKLPDNPKAGRVGKIAWRWVGELEDESIVFRGEILGGYWHELVPGEYAFTAGENCHCFDLNSS